MLEGLATRDKVTGLKQTRRMIAAGRAARVFLARDAEPRLTEPVLELCRLGNIPVEQSCTMQQLGKAAGIQVGTAAVTLLAKSSVFPE